MVAILASRLDVSFRKARRFVRAEVAETRIGTRPVVLARPRTFMNQSGPVVFSLCRYYKVSTSRLLIVHDDIDLPFAKLRVQSDRGSGGHNGVSSIARALGTRDFWRLKVGVGRPPWCQDPAEYVLRRFKADEREEMDLTIRHAANLVELFATDGSGEARQRAGGSGGTS